MLANIEADLYRSLTTEHPLNADNIYQSIEQLLQLPASTEQMKLMERLLVGEIAPDQPFTWAENYALLLYSGWARLINYLHEYDSLTYDIFKRSIWRYERLAGCLGKYKPLSRRYDQLPDLLRQQYCGQHLSEACQVVITEYLDRLGWDAATDFSFQARRILCQLDHFYGSRYLLLAAEYHQRYFSDVINLQPSLLLTIPDTVTTITHVLHNFELEPLMNDKREAIIARLRTLSNTTLMALMPVAYSGQTLLAEAVNWEKAIPLINLIRHTALQSFREGSFGQTDIPNSPDPTAGVINVVEVQAALEEAGEPLAQEVFDLFRKSGADVGNTLTLIEAVAGWNRARVEKGLKSHSQVAIKAYGLLPLEHGRQDVLQRYLRLKQSAKDGKKFGQQRRASHAGAVQVAIANLAQRAGYADAGRFEWAMEAQLAAEVAPAGRHWPVGEYDLELMIDGIDVSLSVKRDGHALKSVPKPVRDHEDYQEAKEAVQQLRSQASRLKNDLLEGLLISGEMLSRDQLDQFLRLPLARGLFERLVWRNDAGEFGLLDAASMLLRDLEGRQHSLTDRVGLAHPHHLYQTNVLAAWQRELVHQRIVQPLKQVFRELYLLTPAEQTTGRYSNRFAGQVVDGSIAARLFGARGWRTTQRGDGVTPYKVFGDVQAVFEFADVLHYLGEGIPVTTDRIYFQKYPVSFAHWNGLDREQTWLPVDQVPALVFSEAMRDADLVVSVAQQAGDARLSNEVFEQRGGVVRTLLDDLGLPGVTVEGHFAYIKGHLAQYRVHLGSATIHIDPGNYLCIVPERWGQKHEKLFLPFADNNDSKISEVISKILLLLGDDKIKDETILRQIRDRS